MDRRLIIKMRTTSAKHQAVTLVAAVQGRLNRDLIAKHPGGRVVRHLRWGDQRDRDARLRGQLCLGLLSRLLCLGLLSKLLCCCCRRHSWLLWCRVCNPRVTHFGEVAVSLQNDMVGVDRFDEPALEGLTLDDALDLRRGALRQQS